MLSPVRFFLSMPTSVGISKKKVFSRATRERRNAVSSGSKRREKHRSGRRDRSGKGVLEPFFRVSLFDRMKTTIDRVRVVLYALYTRLVAFLFRKKRRIRAFELRNHIEIIRAVNGCESADKHLRECIHLSSHYRIPLSEAGFAGTFGDLCIEASDSFGRYVDFFRTKCDETWSLEGVPDELGLIVPTVEGWDDYASVQLYAQALRRLRRLERRRRDFLFHARAFLARAFSCAVSLSSV